MIIESIKLRNFKAFKHVEINDLPRFCVLVGANGSGKSTFFDVFGFLKHCLTYNVKTAFQSRGGFREVISRNVSDETISIELKVKMPIAGKDRLVSYLLEFAEERGKIIVEREVLRYKRSSYGSPFHFLDFKRGQGYAIYNEEDFSKPDEELKKDYQSLDNEHVLAIKGLGQFQRFKAASAFRQLIENWYVSDFHITDARGSKDTAGHNEHLSVSGDNLQLVANNLFENNKDIFDKIVNIMKSRVPGVTNVEPIPTDDGRLLLRFQDGSFKDPFIDKYVSDGTLKMFAYLILLYDPRPHPLLCVEEPENQLYPSLLCELAEEFREYAHRGGQVFVSTHSPDFLNAVELDEVLLIEKKDGYSKITKASNNSQLRDYINAGEKMGYLWNQGLFWGVDPK